MLSPREIDLYIANRDCSCRDIQTICVTQYDNYVPLQIRLYEQKNNKKIPLAIPSGYTAYFNVAHSNGDTSYLNCVINDDSTLTVKLTNTTLSILGRAGCQVVFVGSDESRFSSEIFYLQIGKTLSDDGAAEGTPTFSYFVEQLALMAQLTESITDTVDEVTNARYSDIKATEYDSLGARIEASEVDIQDTQDSVADLQNDKISKTAIINDLTTGGTTNVLSAEQGKQLNTDLGTVKTDITNLQSDILISKTSISKNTSQINSIQSVMTNLNPNGEARVNIDTANQVVPLPINAAPGGVDVAIRGVTLTNLVKNGDFSKGKTNWVSINAVVDGVGEYIAEAQYGNAYQEIPNHANYRNHIVYFCGDIKSTSPNVALGVTDGLVTGNAPHDGSNTFKRLSGISTISPNSTLLRVRIVDTRTSGWDKIYFDNIIFIDLTSIFGVGNEPTKEECDKIFSNYFDGTKSAVAPRLRSVGKNLFDKSWFVSSATEFNVRISETTTGIRLASTSAGTYRRVEAAIQLLPNTQYTIKRTLNIISGCTQTPSARMMVYDSTTSAVLAYISKAENIAKNFTTPSDGMIRLTAYVSTTASDEGIVEFQDIQIEKGPAATAYEPYRESALYIEPYALRHASGVYDEISGGKLIRRVDDTGTVLVDPEIIENVTSGTLISYPGGTIYTEPAIADAGVYNDGISVFYTDFPIESLETVKRVDFETGEQTPLDVSDAVISPDGKSFTHPDLADGDIVFFTYFYDVPRVGSINTYSYLDSNYVRQDSVTGKFYRRDWEVVDGQYYIVLKEVQ